mmetsp:Transcript_41687/g.124528  ORF Transcript_41687/g.124528 Transcript_41687/m.124528 type:complete len:288 (-) Transcript_41687:358-1221(-)
MELRVHDRGLPHLLPVLLDAQVLPVEVARELVAVVDVDPPVVHLKELSDDEVLRLADDRVWLSHAGGDVRDRVLFQRGPPPEDGEGVAAGVPCQVLVDLHGVVRQVVVHVVVQAGAVVRGVVPEALEAQDLAVVPQELLQPLVLVVPAEEELVVLPALRDLAAPRRRQPVGLRGLLAGPEGVQGHLLRALAVAARLLVEGAGEVVAVGEPVDAAVDVDAAPALQVLVGEEAASRLLRPGEAVALDQGTLEHAGVLLLGLGDHHRPVLQVVVDHALPHPEVLLGTLRH